jgi:4-hydroxybenzoate polyprenyltransferase
MQLGAEALKAKGIYLQFFRVSDWIHVLGLTLLGFIFASGSDIVFRNLFLSLLISSLYLAFGYSLNDYFDIYARHRGANDTPLPVPFKKALILSLLALILNCFISLSFSIYIFWLVIAGATLAWLYSATPLRLKERPFWELICNSLGFSILFLVGFASAGAIDVQAILMTIFIFLLFLPLQLIHELNDLRQDCSKGINTTAVKFGIIISFNLIFLFLALLIGYTFILHYLLKTARLFWLTILFCAALAFILLRRLDRHSRRLDTRRLKLDVRYICIVYGLGVLGAFLFSR